MTAEEVYKYVSAAGFGGDAARNLAIKIAEATEREKAALIQTWISKG